MKAGIKKTNRVTKFATGKENQNKWHIVDADGKNTRKSSKLKLQKNKGEI